MKKIGDKIELHKALKTGFSNLYGYTSDADGIRHPMLEKANPPSEDAKYMLISCSAFINYLIAKAKKAGIDYEYFQTYRYDKTYHNKNRLFIWSAAA